jgi:hypothetical protein
VSKSAIKTTLRKKQKKRRVALRQKTDVLTFEFAMLERALREGYAVFQNYISPGTAAGVLALDYADATWARIFLKEKDSADGSADEGADGCAAGGAKDSAEGRDPDRIELEMDEYRLMRDLPEHLIEDLED